MNLPLPAAGAPPAGQLVFHSYRLIVTSSPPTGAVAPNASVATADPVGAAVPPAVGERTAVPVPAAPTVPDAAGLGVAVLVVPVVANGVPTPGDVVPGVPTGLPIGTTVVLGGGRVAVACARAIAATVAETRACTVPSTFTGAAVSPPHPASSAPTSAAAPIFPSIRMRPRTLTSVCYNRRPA